MGSLPNKSFICNYNAKLFDAATNTIPNADGASFNSGLTLNRAPDVVGDGYIALNTAGNSTRCDYVFSSNADNPFLRTGSDAITIVAKVNAITNQGNSYQCLLSCRNGTAVNYGIYTRSNDFGTDLAFPTRYGASRSNTSCISSPTYPNIFEFTVSNGTSMGYSYTNETASTVQQFSWTGANNRFTFFGVYGNSNEDWSGEFHWVYISPEALTDAEIRQVINYNENLSTGFSVDPDEINFSKFGDEAEITVESETNWTATTADSWISFTPTAGTSADTTVTVAAPANHTALRTGTLSFVDGDNNTAVVNITQPNIVAGISLDNLRNGSSYVNKMYIGSTYVYKRFGLNNIILNIQDAIDISSDGETVSVPVSSNASWTAATTDAWITITNPTGSGDGSFSVTAAATESGRAGNITVTAEKGGFTTVKTVEVKQTVMTIPPDNQIWYWTKDNNPVTPDSRFNPNVTLVSNVYDATKQCCVMTFSGSLISSDWGPFNNQVSGTNGITAIAVPNSFKMQRIAASLEDLETVIIGSGYTYFGDGGLQSNISMKEIYCYATTAPTLHQYAFVYFLTRHPAENGVLHIPQGCTASYSDWMTNTQYRLGYYHWTVVDDLPNPNL